MLKKEAKQFCLNTDLHGYRFIVLPKRILLERFGWVGVCLTSIIAAITLLSFAWFSFREDPVVTVTDSNHYPVWHYAFPSITVCDFNKISRKGAVELAKKLGDPSRDKELIHEIRLLTYLFAYNIYKKDHLSNLTKLQDLLDKQNISVNSALSISSTKCEDMLVKCIWKRDQKRCETIFEKIKTTNGFCCSFNYYALKNHIFGRYTAHSSPKEPRRVSACGYLTGLEVLLNINVSDYLATLMPSFGYRVIIHNPYDFPDWNSKSSLVRMKSVNFIGLDPTLTYSSDEVSKIPAENRICLFDDEKKLYFYERYSYHNCMVECRMNLTLQLCHCIPFFDIPDDVDLKLGRICNLRDIPCLSKNFDLIRSSVPGYNFSNLDPFHAFGSEKGACKCLPDCKVTDYNLESSSGILSRQYSMNHQSLYGGVKLENHSVFRVFFNDLIGMRNRKDVRFSWHTLLAFYGGLLGFFMGFSFVSGIEIIYFFAIRPFTSGYKKDENKVIRIFDKRTIH